MQFAEVMKKVSVALSNASIRVGDRPASDQAVGAYLSFRRDYDDLINPMEFDKKKQLALGRTEDEAQELLYIKDSRADYAEHKHRMRSTQLFGLLHLAMS